MKCNLAISSRRAGDGAVRNAQRQPKQRIVCCLACAFVAARLRRTEPRYEIIDECCPIQLSRPGSRCQRAALCVHHHAMYTALGTQSIRRGGATVDVQPVPDADNF